MSTIAVVRLAHKVLIPAETNMLLEILRSFCKSAIERDHNISPLDCSTNLLTGFSMMTTLAFQKLNEILITRIFDKQKFFSKSSTYWSALYQRSMKVVTRAILNICMYAEALF